MSRRYWEWEPVFKMSPSETALLIVDMQNGFVEPGAPVEVPLARDCVPAIGRLLRFCRQTGVPVVFAKFCVSPDFKYPFYWSMARQKGLGLEPPTCAFWEGKHETEIIPELAPRVGERVVKKCGYDAFAGTELDQILHSLNVKCLIVTGVSTNSCVDSTVRGAFHRFYNVVVAADGVAALARGGGSAELWQELELNYFAEALGRVVKVDDIIRELSEA
ncbi:MAG: cysteine hydrolase family protein [Chloroflexota bacterium]